MIIKFNNYIVESGESIDELETLTPDQLGELLIIALRKDSTDVQYIKDLLAVGCPITPIDKDGWTALHYAALHGKMDIVEILISSGIDVNAKNNAGWGAIHLAANYGHLRIIKFLLSNGADDTHLLQYAARVGSNSVVEFLISRGDDINARDIHGWTALHSAASGGHIDITKFLLSKGADIHIKDKFGNTAWEHAASKLSRHKIPELNPNK